MTTYSAPLTVIKPLNITDAMIISHSVSETEPTWAGSPTEYSIGDRVKYGADHDAFSSLVDSNVGNAPVKWPDSTSYWYDEGKTMPYNMFDLTTNIQTEGASPMTVVIAPGEPVTAVHLDTLEADTVIIEESVSGYSKTIDTRSRDTIDWYTYWYEPFRYRRIVSVYDIPAGVSAPVITVTFINSTGLAKCGGFIIGRHYVIGNAGSNGSAHSRKGFSVFERDEIETSRVRLRYRGSVKNPKIKARIEENRIDTVMSILDDIDGIAASWAVKQSSSDSWYGAFALRGVYRSPVNITVVEDPSEDSADAYLEIELEGI